MSTTSLRVREAEQVERAALESLHDAATPKFRQRGSQAAVLAARINHAVELGCRRLYSCTGEEVPGDPQHSYKNILKAGFRETYIKENYAPPKKT